MPPVAEIDPAQRLEARRVSLERIEGYGAIQNVGGRNGAIVREVGRVAETDLEFAFEIVRDFEPDLKINALIVIGKNSGELGALSDARDHTESENLEPAEKSRKLASIAKAAADIDAQFAFETALSIPNSAPKVDILLEIAKRSKFIDGLNRRNTEDHGADPKDINFSMGLFREMVREADREIGSSNIFRNDRFRNRRLAEVSAGFELGVTLRAEKREIESIERTKPIDVDAVALHGVQRYIRGYIKEGDFEGLEEADPSGDIVIEAFRARLSEYGGEGDDLSVRLGFGDELLDPVTDAAELLRHLDRMRSITFQNPKREQYQALYRSLLPIILVGSGYKIKEFEEAKVRQTQVELEGLEEGSGSDF